MEEKRGLNDWMKIQKSEGISANRKVIPATLTGSAVLPCFFEFRSCSQDAERSIATELEKDQSVRMKLFERTKKRRETKRESERKRRKKYQRFQFLISGEISLLDINFRPLFTPSFFVFTSLSSPPSPPSLSLSLSLRLLYVSVVFLFFVC